MQQTVQHLHNIILVSIFSCVSYLICSQIKNAFEQNLYLQMLLRKSLTGVQRPRSMFMNFWKTLNYCHCPVAKDVSMMTLKADCKTRMTTGVQRIFSVFIIHWRLWYVLMMTHSDFKFYHITQTTQKSQVFKCCLCKVVTLMFFYHTKH